MTGAERYAPGPVTWAGAAAGEPAPFGNAGALSSLRGALGCAEPLSLKTPRLYREKTMKKKEIRKPKLSKDTLRQLTDDAPLDKAAGGQPTTTVLSRWPTCNC